MPSETKKDLTITVPGVDRWFVAEALRTAARESLEQYKTAQRRKTQAYQYAAQRAQSLYAIAAKLDDEP